jgi:hypothetical protein
VRYVGREQDPLSGSEFESFVGHVEDGVAVENDNPLVFVLEIVDRSVRPATQDLIDHDMVQADQSAVVFPGDRRGVGSGQAAANDGHRPTLPPR